MPQAFIEHIDVLIAFFLIFIVSIFAWLSMRKRKVLELSLKDITEQLEEQSRCVTELKSKYSSIIDMEEHVQKLLKESQERASANVVASEKVLAQARNDAEKVLIEANAESEQIIKDSKELNSKANQKLRDAKDKVLSLTEEAHSEASLILERAKEEAQLIAGDAYEAKEKADSYASAIKAMKNTIEGYKDDYIIPNHSLLDSLAEDFGFKEAGEKLKKARKRVRDMVKQGRAGDCDYVENHRKTYAIHFAVDAFNGKVDSALAKVKHDNYGKIKQEIVDAFALVNHNGKPFRNARINQSFLDARKDELKWAVSTHELRQIELAEQREIKQQIREEERARKEIEKAIREAEKEERIIQKALEKARAELASANEEQRKDFEAQLAELEGKLSEAEDRGQRALSMAQQTRRGHVYIISNIGSFGENIFKIGMTRRLEPMDRVKELGDASVPFSFDVHAMIYSEDAPLLEKELHRRFERDSVNKINPRKEFFRTTLAEIKQTVEQQNLSDVHWTMKAEATEYRESLAIQAQLLEDHVA